MKKLLAVLMAICVVLGAAGCSGKGDSGKKDDGLSGKIVIYTSMYEDIIDDMKTALKQKFPSLEIEFFQGGSGTIQSKIAAERDAGKMGCDILMVAEPSYALELKEAGILHPYQFADKDKLVFDYDAEGYWYPVRVCNMILAYNPEKYDKASVPQTFKAFAEDANMKGMLSMSNPLTSGTAYSSAVGLYDKYGEEYLKALAGQNVAVESGSVALAKLETGECAEIMVLEESVLKKREEEGSKLEVIYPEDGCIPVPSPIMIIDEKVSANANIKAAEAVEEFFLSPEGQKLIVKGWMYGVRSDFTEYPYDGIPLEQLLGNTIKVDWVKCYKQREEMRTLFQQYIVDAAK
ncbi:MAG: ABC transporter substrate-binding protein [Firmicutes bacterium]|nr:ABC transporter substrate-binding protein [Bacillota bacterium]